MICSKDNPDANERNILRSVWPDIARGSRSIGMNRVGTMCLGKSSDRESSRPSTSIVRRLIVVGIIKKHTDISGTFSILFSETRDINTANSWVFSDLMTSAANDTESETHWCRACSISPISTRWPLTLTWPSLRPAKSMVPSEW